jgi:hypothetical protein
MMISARYAPIDSPWPPRGPGVGYLLTFLFGQSSSPVSDLTDPTTDV